MYIKQKNIYLKKNGHINVKIDKIKSNIPILVFIQAMGITEKKIFYSLKSEHIISNLKQNQNLLSITESMISLTEQLLEQKTNLV